MLSCRNSEEQKQVANMCGGRDPSHEHVDRVIPLEGISVSPSNAKKDFQHGDTCLLELAANNEVWEFQVSVEERNDSVDAIGSWYVRHHGTRQMVLEQRTPIMIVALYCSMDVLKYVLHYHVVNAGEIDQACGTDGSSALHCAATGGSPRAMEAIKLLLNAGADVNVRDTHGRRPIDVLTVSPGLSGMKEALLELLSQKRLHNASIAEGSSLAASSKTLLDEVHSAPCSPMSPLGTSKAFADDTVKCRGYPVDTSLPDIKNSFYMTDEFRMYSFKIRPCSRAYSHDWTECPFAHPGENARRRDPRRYHYSCVPCPDYRKGECSQGDACEYAHGVFESWLHPAQYRTRLCKDGTECNRRVCFFAHTAEELRPLYVSTGSGLPSPISSGFTDVCSMSPPLAPCSPLMPPTFSPLHPVQSTIQGTLRTPPISPSSSCVNGSWSQPTIPTLHLPGASLQASRLRSAFTAHDSACTLSDFDGQIINDFQSVSAHSLSTQARLNAAMAASGNVTSSGRAKYKSLGLNVVPAKLDELFALESSLPGQFVRSDDHSQILSQVLPQEQLNVRQAAYTQCSFSPPATKGSFDVRPFCGQGLDVERQLLSKASLPPVFTESPKSPLVRNQKGSQSSCESGRVGLMWSDWGSPTGKPEWGLQENDMLKMGKSPSFRIKASEETDPSWMKSLGKHGQHLEMGPTSVTSVCYDDNEGVDTSSLASWIDSLFLDQIVA